MTNRLIKMYLLMLFSQPFNLIVNVISYLPTSFLWFLRTSSKYRNKFILYFSGGVSTKLQIKSPKICVVTLTDNRFLISCLVTTDMQLKIWQSPNIIFNIELPLQNPLIPRRKPLDYLSRVRVRVWSTQTRRKPYGKLHRRKQK